MESHLIGEIAALCTSVLWTTCSVLFASAGKRIGVLSVNALRLPVAMSMIGVTHLILYGTLVPPATTSQWAFMSLSGFIGLILGDFGYLGALVLIGPRKGVLLMSMAPIFSTISAYFILNETLSMWAVLGITVTLLGIVIVVIEREEDSEDIFSGKKEAIGVIFGLGGSIGQGVGLTISKYGMVAVASTSLDPLSATFIRLITATLIIWLIVAIVKDPLEILKTYKDSKGVMRTIGGAISGPFLGIWLSMVAVTYTVAGVASTLMSLMPIMVIPVVWILYKERTNLQGIVGAIIAVIGVAILFMR